MEYTQERISEFIDFMKLVDGTPLISVDFMDWLLKNKFFEKPAAINHHGNYLGGLYDHSKAVTECLLNLTNNGTVKWQNPRSPYIIGMFHDLCKIDDYVEVTDTSSELTWQYNKDKILGGHGDKSIILLSQFINLTEEEIMCIRFHMGAYETESWDAYDKAIRKYPGVLWTHTADMWAAKINNT